MKVALVHEWLTSVGGSDKVLKLLSDMYPEANIYVLVSNPKITAELNIDERRIKNSFLQKLPFAKKQYRNYLPLFPFAVESFDLSEYDIIISSSHAVAKGILKNSNQLHVTYCHSPMRYAWDLYFEYTKNLGYFKKRFARLVLFFIRIWDITSSNRVDYFIANSNYISARIKNIYGRESEVIYPPVKMGNFKDSVETEDYFITISRLVEYKKVDIIVKAFNEMPNEKLKIIGSGPELKHLKKLSKANIEFLGFVEDEKMESIVEKAKAFVYAADEDFGMLPVEVQSLGVPVIGYKKGGLLETVIEGETGLFFNEQNEKSLIEIIQRFNQFSAQFDRNKIRLNAEKFTEELFKERIKSFIDEKAKIL